MQRRDELCRELTRQFRDIRASRSQQREKTEELLKKFDIPISVSTDYISLRDNVQNANDFLLYCFLSVFREKRIPIYFSNSEANHYRDSKFKVKKLHFPLKFDMVQVANDQWIGMITVKELMQLRDAQICNYNENAQRSMEHIVSGGTEYYRIAVNENAVRGIMDSFENETYIPNTITLNMPDGTDFYYEDDKLYVRNIDHFDILDGYHRFVALSRIFNLNHNFNYSMELRIVNFPESKAKQFIWQEDQKTKMRKIDSDSFNQNNAANKVVQRLNGDSSFNLSGNISRNNGIINSAYLGQAVSRIYMHDVRKKTENIRVIEVTKELKDKINYITEQDYNLLEKPWTRKFTICVVYSCSIHNNYDEILPEVNRLNDLLKKPENRIMFKTTSTISGVDLKRLEKLRKDGEL